MNAADVVVLPFRTDPQTLLTSGSAVLAKQFGRPVVTPAVGCNPCMLACGGILYGENESLSAALRAARSADLRAMGEWNRQDLESITWSDIATQTASVYRSAVNGTSAG
jgi:glycosyltransferase involved in cell wall biosynthesis